MSFWRLASGTDGKSFGDRLWIEIHVREDVNSASSSQSLASSMVRMPQARSTAATAHSAKTSTQSSTHPDRRSSSTAITVSAASSEADDDLSVISAEDDFVILSDDQETTSSLSNQDHHVSANSWVQNH